MEQKHNQPLLDQIPILIMTYANGEHPIQMPLSADSYQGQHYSRTSMARTLMACLPRLFRTRS